MADKSDPFAQMFEMQQKAMADLMAGKMPGSEMMGADLLGSDMMGMMGTMGGDKMGAGSQWANSANQMQEMWADFLKRNSENSQFDPAQIMLLSQGMAKGWQSPLTQNAEATEKLVQDGLNLWQTILAKAAGQTQGDEQAGKLAPEDLPRKDRRFADEAWREHPAYALLQQTYLMLAEYFVRASKDVDGVSDENKAYLKFATQALVDAMSPDNFLATNPVVLKRTIETGGQNLVKGLGHLIRDLERGQLTHSDADAFTLGENLAATPGQVIHQTPLFQLIQYSPTTDKVLETPLVIFPPWINRFYILDLTPKKSFIKWAVDQGMSVFVVSWKSADESTKDVVWDDYIRAQMEAIDHIRDRLKVQSVHTIGYCVAGTTLAATLAILARRGQADKVKTATFFTAQVDFENAGELLNFIDDNQLQIIEQMAPDGYVDGRYLAATFNSLRGKDLIWNYVVNNYLMGEDYPAFDMLHWNGDVTNLPAKWHSAYLRDLYRDNKLVIADEMSADGTPIDLSLIKTPAFLQAGKEDHIAPAKSVWKATEHFSGDVTFLLAGSGHIAGVVNPPSANKYQYWVGDSHAPSLDAYIESAEEHPGSWWPHWLEWIKSYASKQVKVTGKRKPGGRGDKVIEPAPGTYVKTR